MRNFRVLFLVLWLLALAGCSDAARYDEPADLNGERIGIIHGAISAEEITTHFPASKVQIYEKPMALFLDIEVGHCEAAIMEQESAAEVLNRNSDYATLGALTLADKESPLSIIVPRTMIATESYEGLEDAGWLQTFGDRIHRNLFSEDAWQLIFGGLCTTVVIFIFAALLAILLGSLLAYMAINHRWPWLYRPLNWFIFTIHDVPSVVLMMFFYYVLFAGQMNGIVVSIIALGVYTSGSLAKVFKIHIMQVGKEQHEAGRMLGFTPRQCYRYIILPQAAKTMLPLVVAELKVQLRATSYAGYIAQKDLVKAVDAIRGLTFDAFVPLLLVSILYLILSWLIAHSMELLYHKLFHHD